MDRVRGRIKSLVLRLAAEARRGWRFGETGDRRRARQVEARWDEMPWRWFACNLVSVLGWAVVFK